MVATLQSRKEALEAKILEKNEELKKLCLQEADLTGIMPPEIPLEPGEPPPPIRRRIGTSFSFPQNLINNMKDADDESLTALELECKVQTNIAEAALALANDSSANKAARRKHRLMYRQSQRRLLELETRLNLLRQGKLSQQTKPQQVKKKPRPNTTAVENLGYLWKKTNEQNPNYYSASHLGSWPGKIKPDHNLDDLDRHRELPHQNDMFRSLQRSFKSSEASQSSSSPRTDIDSEEFKLGLNQLFNSNLNHFVPTSVSNPNIQENDSIKGSGSFNPQHNKRSGKRNVVRRQWDTQSAGGTLLPSQTYPEYSHQPNLSRTQSLGSVESNPQKSKDSWSMQDFPYEGNTSKEKEWYETSLDSAPSPPLRTSSRLPSSTRMLYQMQERQTKDPGNWNNVNIGGIPNILNAQLPIQITPNVLQKTIVRNPYPCNENSFLLDNLANSVQHLGLSSTVKDKTSNIADSTVSNQKEFFYNFIPNELRHSSEYSNIPKVTDEGSHHTVQNETTMKHDTYSTSNDLFLQKIDSITGLPLIRHNSLGSSSKYSGNNEEYIKTLDDYKLTNKIYSNDHEDSPDGISNNWISEELTNNIKTKQVAVPQEYTSATQVLTPSQPYYHHATKYLTGEKIKNLQYQASRNRHASINEETSFLVGTSHPPHAITQSEISFDTVVPFESPQNHTVVQAGKWQPYREVTKPFEMSDFYKYSTKFRQNQAQGSRAITPDASTNLPNKIHQKGIYTPLKPMTCRPVESRACSQVVNPSQGDTKCEEIENSLVEVSPPEIV